MGSVDFPRVMLAGFIATLTMTLVWYPASIITNTPVFDFAAVLGSAVGDGRPPMWSGVWWLGMLEHFLNGTLIFPFFYGYVLFNLLPGESILKGVLFGILLWVGSQITIMPLMGLGFFGERSLNPLMTAFVTFNGHLVYGLLLGSIAGKPGKGIASSADNTMIQMGGFTSQKRAS